MIGVSIIIPNWNGEDLLPDCLNSLKKQTFKDFEVILVDNFSKDNSIERALHLYPEIRILKLEKNFGFAKTINEGVKISFGKYLIFLNNDTSVEEKFIEQLVKFADKNPEVISVNPKILNYYERDKIDGLGIDINEIGQARSLSWNEIDSGQFQNSIFIFGATGGASLFRKKEFLELEMFDEDYFMYYEEVDFAFRAQFKGFKSLYCPKAIAYHKHKATSGKNLNLVEYWQLKNMVQTVIKDFPAEILLNNKVGFKIFLVFFHTIYFQIRNGYFWPPVKTFFWLFVNFPYLINKRRKNQKEIKVSIDYLSSFFTEKKITVLKTQHTKLAM